MGNWWIKFGCFLTGYNYSILRVSSEASVKAVKRYTSALLIVCILWTFVGFSFTFRYMNASIFESIIGGITFCIIIVQIERQIILNDTKNNSRYYIRGIIAITMALIGSIIIDQIIFREDIEQGKILTIDSKVNQILPGRQAELKSQINQLDTAINSKEAERKLLSDDISKNPTIKSYNSISNTVAVPTTTTDSTRKTTTSVKLVHTNNLSISSIANPKIALLNPLDIQIVGLRAQKNKKDSILLTLRPMVEKEIKEHTGFLDELKIMFKILFDSGVALFVWLLWLVLLTGIEIFIMVNKIGALQTDYDLTIIHHMDLQKRKLSLLEKSGSQP